MRRYILAINCLVSLAISASSSAQTADANDKGQAGPPTVERFGIVEVTVKAQGQYENPYRDASADAVITPPNGDPPRKASLFWYGDNVWKLRFSPDKTGDWIYEVISRDLGLNGAGGSVRCLASTRTGSIRPMPKFPRHFERQDGKPFWFLGDTAWALFTDNADEKHNRAAALEYIDTRAAQGINVVHSHLLSEAGWGNQGGKPWLDLAAERINPAYWQEVDVRLAHANLRGMVCGLALAWGDKGRGEPFAWRKFSDIDARKRYARYIAARYSAYDTFFLVSGEWHAEIGTRDSSEEIIEQEFVEIGNAFREVDPHKRMIAIHPMTAHGSVREFAGSAPWMDFGDYQQNYQNLHARVLESRPANLPIVNSEYGYFLRDQSGDGIPDKDNSTSLAAMRNATWDIVMAGGYPITGFGTTYFGGNRDPGPFDLHAAKNKLWEMQFGQVKSILSELDWWLLEPHDELLTCDSPRGRDGKELGHITPPAATYWCLADPGKTYLVYLRGLESDVSVALKSSGKAFSVARLDPHTGERTVLDGNSGGTYQIRPPDRQPWLVLIQAADK